MNADEHDAWLCEALRHAPDAQVGPPPALSELILREAQAKARATAPPRASVSTAARWWASLAQPSVGAAFASVMVATVVALLWWDRPLEEHAPRPAAATPPAPATTRSEANAKSESVRAPVRSARGADSLAKQTDAVPAAGSLTERRIAPAPQTPAGREPAPEPDRQRVATAPPAADATGEAARGAVAMAPAGPPPAPTAPMPMAAALPRTAAAPARSAEAADKPTEARQRVALAAESAPLAELRTSLSVDAPRWSWQRGSGPTRSVGDGLAAWLAELDAATRGQWQREQRSNAAGATRDEAAPADELLLLHDGRVAHRLHIDGSAVRWDIVARDTNEALRWQATLEPARARSLRLLLDDTTR